MNLVDALGGIGKGLTELLPEKALKDVSALAALAQRAPDLAGSLGTNDPIEMLDVIKARLEDPVLIAAFSTLGAETLLEDIGKTAASITDKMPESLKTLLRPVSALTETAVGTTQFAETVWTTGDDTGLVGWSADGTIWSGKAGSAGGPEGGFRLGGSIAAECEAGSLWFYANDEIAPTGLVRVGISGSLEAGADGRVPFGALGSVGVEAAAGVACHAHLFWRKAPDTLFAVAMGEIVAAPIDIFSLDAVLAASRPDNGFVGFVLALKGHASLDVDLALAREFDVEGLFSGTAGLTVSVELSRAADYELSVHKIADGLRVVLSHGEEDADNWGLGLGIDIDAGPLVDRVGKLLFEAADKWDAVLREVQPFLTPGTWLRDNAAAELAGLLESVEQQVGDPDLVAALHRDLRLALGFEESGAGLGEALSKRLLAAIGSIEGVATEKVDEIADKAIAGLRKSLPSFADAGLATALLEPAKGLISQLQGAFVQRVEDLAAGRGAELDTALQKLGQKVSGAADELDERTKGVRALIAKADKLIHELAERTKDAAIAKMSLRLRFEKKRLANEQFEFVADIVESNEQTRAVYRALMHGRLQGVVRHLDPTQPAVPGLVLNKEKTSIRRFTSVSKTRGFELVLFGVNIWATRTSSGNADIVLSADDSIVVNAVSTASRAAHGWNEERSIRFVQTYSLLIARAEGDARLPTLQSGMAIDLASTRSDDNLSADEAKEFLGGLAQFGLIAAARPVLAEAYVRSVPVPLGKPEVPGAISVSMTFSRAEVAALVALGNGFAGDATNSRSDAARAVFDAALSALFLTGDWSQRDFPFYVDKYIRRRESEGTVEERIAASRKMLFENRAKLPKPPPSGPKATPVPVDARFTAGKERHEALLSFMRIIGQLAEITNAQPRGFASAGANGWGEEQYRQAEARIADDAQDWIKLNRKLIFFFKDGMHRRTLAFMRALADLANGDQPQPQSYDHMFSLSLGLGGNVPKAF